MKEIFISQLKIDEEIVDYFMLKSFAIKVGSNKKQYLDLVLGDNTGEVTAKKWDLNELDLEVVNTAKEGDVVKIKANVTEWNGMKQLRVTRLRHILEEDNIEPRDYIKSAPETSESMFNYIREVASSMKDEDLKKLCLKVLDENADRLRYYPAASKNHHAEYGGLLYHVKRMLMTGLAACKIYTNLNQDLVAAGVILHDMEKLNEIEANEMGIASGYSFEGQMLGHIIQGVKTLDKMTTELNFPKEKAIMVEHMILSHHYEPEFGSPKKPLFPEAELLHYLDILDARMYDMEHALEATSEGDFSDKVWTLENRKIYKPIG